jgi:hypothetical protein
MTKEKLLSAWDVYHYIITLEEQRDRIKDVEVRVKAIFFDDGFINMIKDDLDLFTASIHKKIDNLIAEKQKELEAL